MANKEEILINVTPQETRCAVIENGLVKELLLERAQSRGIVGDIFKGKVVRVLPGMQAAFVDIGLERNAFLHASDIARADAAFGQKPEKHTASIQELLHEGASVQVQVIKDPIGDKGARLTTELSMASRNLVYLPQGAEIGISQKIDSADERARLRALVQSLIQQHELSGGIIIRTLAESARDEDIANDIAFLRRLWDHTRNALRQAKPASRVFEGSPLMLRTIRDLVHENLEVVRIDSREGAEQAIEFATKFVPELVNKIEHYSDQRPLFELYCVEQEIQHAMKRKVMLKSGGDLIIDQTEAMTIIDVNTGSFVGRRDNNDTLFKTNLEAATEIAHQLRLRNLGGIIIVDFIDMQSAQHKEKILSALQTALRRDRVKTHITDMSPLGLVEITRKRTSESLEQLMCERCVVCEGRGKVKTVQTVCYEILREIIREDRQYKALAYTVIAAPAVIDVLLDDQASYLADLQESIERPIKLRADSHYHQQQYDIALN